MRQADGVARLRKAGVLVSLLEQVVAFVGGHLDGVDRTGWLAMFPELVEFLQSNLVVDGGVLQTFAIGLGVDASRDV